MATTFEAYKYVGPYRHLSSMELLSLRDNLRDENLSVVKSKTKKMLDGTVIVGAGTCKLVTVIDTTRVKDGSYTVKTSVEDAMDHHIAINIILLERGFTARIDDTPELTIDMS